MNVVKLVQMGESVGLILPTKALARLKLGVGDAVYLTEVEGGLMLTSSDLGLAKQLEHSRELMQDFGDTLRKLAE